jgi:hypothetical protein
MFPGLRHHAFVGSNNECDNIDPVRASKHVFNEAFVAGHIDKTNPDSTEIQISKAEIDGDSTSLFFGQTIRIASRQGPHKRALSMINMTGCAHDN